MCNLFSGFSRCYVYVGNLVGCFFTKFKMVDFIVLIYIRTKW
jgi:hypothetical protein